MPSLQPPIRYAKYFGLWLNYCAKPSTTIVVLGMHRSGTSFITQALHQCGAAIGNNLLKTRKSNEAGHWESIDGIRINRQILYLSGGDWANPPASICANWRVHWKIRFFLGKLHARNSLTVWKDPRTVLTFPIWKPFLRNYFIVAIYRHPLSVAHSLQKRNGFSLEKGIDLWLDYNSKLLELSHDEPNIYWINFDGGFEYINKCVQDLVRILRMPKNHDIDKTYQPALRKSDTVAPMKSNVRSLYLNLLAKTQMKEPPDNMEEAV